MGYIAIDSDDFGKTKIEILMDLIYETNKVRIPQEHITYGIPVALDQRPDIDIDENTYIPVKIDVDYDDRLSKNGGFLYRRQELTDYFEDLNVSITVTNFPFTIRSIWNDQINPYLPYPIDSRDIEDFLFTDPTQTSVIVKTTKESLIFTGQVRIRVNTIDPTFFSLAPIPYLTGFVEYTV